MINKFILLLGSKRDFKRIREISRETCYFIYWNFYFLISNKMLSYFLTPNTSHINYSILYTLPREDKKNSLNYKEIDTAKFELTISSATC